MTVYAIIDTKKGRIGNLSGIAPTYLQTTLRYFYPALPSRSRDRTGLIMLLNLFLVIGL